MLRCKFKSITLPKLGNSVRENEDNLLSPCNTDDTLLKFAIADGATETSFAKEWSDLLVTYFKDNSFEKDKLHSTLDKATKSWQSLVTAVELPWYAQQKVEIGAFSTFLGLMVNREESNFRSVAIGDCTLFQIRNNELKVSFPVLSANEYGNTPFLLSSNPMYQKGIEVKVKYLEGELIRNDMLILATDALAAWILEGAESGRRPWNGLQCLLGFEDYKIDFQNWLNNKRREREIKNDDATLIILNFE